MRRKSREIIKKIKGKKEKGHFNHYYFNCDSNDESQFDEKTRQF